MRLERILNAVQNHLKRTAAYSWSRLIPDKRRKRGRRFSWGKIMGALWAGALTAARNLRAVERLTERMACRISDTTFWRTLTGLDPEPFNALLKSEVLRAWRAKEMQSMLPFSLVVIDGKTIWVGDHQANTYCQRQEQDGRLQFQMKVLRASWVSSPCRIVIGQSPIATDNNDGSAFPRFFDQLMNDYGNTEMLEVFSVDAGFISKANADIINRANRGYIMALKNPQKELVWEAERVLGGRRKPDAESPWERYQGKRIRRLLFRTTEMAGYNGWTHLREVWRVRQETEDHGKLKIEERYFVTNLPPASTREDIPLRLVRAHWLIENAANWTLDTQWMEDDGPWASSALEVVSLMRLLAYNVVSRLRARRLRSEQNRQRPWRDLLDFITDLLVLCRLTWIEQLSEQAEEDTASA